MSAAKPKTSPLLGSKGWDEAVDSRLIRASQKWDDAAEFRTHGHVLRRLFEDVKIDAVLCVEGRPTVCVKDARTLSSADVESIRHQLWNLGATTLFVVESSSDVLVFSTLVRPESTRSDGQQALLSHETIKDFHTVELALRLRRLVHRVETGAIYREHKSLFAPQGSVDRILLNNLRELRNLISHERTQEAYRKAHALIGRFLFSCYLLDRHIIGPAYLQKAGLPQADDMLGLLGNTSKNGVATIPVLFKALQRDFNGSLFGGEVDDGEVLDSELAYLQRFLSGENLRSGQLSLFKLYDFAYIPVELISSIYEEFLGAEASLEENSNSAQGSQAHSQRKQGAYYTPPRLAELAVDIATEGWDTLLDKRCLDPACGSGVFLVILFIRMAEEWRKRNPGASTTQRYEELLRLLSENLHGIDIHPTACLVTCFSLYLAFLDQMEPKEVTELREALEHDTRKKILPRILWEADKPRPKSPHFATVRGLDFFTLATEKEFDLVIGNPPWVSRKAAPTAEAWLMSTTKNPYTTEISQSDLSTTLFPARELACAFMWKAGLHLHPQGRVCQVLPSRVFLSNNSDRFQAKWLLHHRLEAVWLLADWRFVLFPTADCPCFITRYRTRAEAEALGPFDFITPKVELLDPREALIPVLPEDQKTLSEVDIASAAASNDAAAAWKHHHWGTPRDARLVERLMRFPRLKRIAVPPPSGKVATSQRAPFRWYKGQGFRPATRSTTSPHPIFWSEKDLFLPATAPVSDLFLLRNDCEPIGNRYEQEGLDRKRNPLLFSAPLLLINKACTKFLFSEFDVLFQDDFQSICAPRNEEDELLFLTAVLSSPLIQYLLFHTTANIGIERDIARLEEILELPFPLPQDMQDPQRSESALRACANLMRNLRGEVEKPENLLRRESLVAAAKVDIDRLVYDYFEICEWEADLIRDTVDLLRPSSTPTSLQSDKLLTAKPSTAVHRKEYATTLLKTFRGWSRTNRHLWAETSTSISFGLALTTLGLSEQPKAYSESVAEEPVMRSLDGIRKLSTNEGVLFARLRGFVFYEPDRVHILKPLNRRHWTRTAALNDADEILARMMQEGGWRD